jgi:hypothetical protein
MVTRSQAQVLSMRQGEALFTVDITFDLEDEKPSVLYTANIRSMESTQCRKKISRTD